jgi:hypothetical protein
MRMMLLRASQRNGSGLQFVLGQVSDGALCVFEFHQFPWNSTIARMYFSKPVFDGPLRPLQFRQKARRVQLKYGILKSLLPVGLSTSVRDYLHGKVSPLIEVLLASMG